MHIFIDNSPVDLTIGIDHFSFEISKDRSNQGFYGIKNIPVDPSIHVIHFQHSDNGIRYGYWFESDISEYLQFKYSAQEEIFVPSVPSDDQEANSYYNKFQELNYLMLGYPSIDEGDTWYTLTRYLKWKELVHISENKKCNRQLIYVDSSMTTREENTLLNKVLKARNKDTEQEIIIPSAEPILNYTPIVFKSVAAMRSDHKTEDYLDKSWYLKNVILQQYHYNSMRSLFGELQFALLNAVFFGNYGSSLQWHNILELICLSSQVETKLIRELDTIVSNQLKIIPEPYAEILLNEQMWAKCLLNSFHGDKLVKTSKQIEGLLPHVIPERHDSSDIEEREESLLPEEAHGFSNSGGYQQEEEEAEEEEQEVEDEYKPVIVSSVQYIPRDHI